MDLPNSALERLIKKAGAKRVSANAGKALGEILEAKGREIAVRAGEFAEHSGRKTIRDSDIRLAADMK
jgi:histone H3/H4